MTDFIAAFSCNGTYIANHDGDTISVILDRGLYDYKGTETHPQPLRLAGIAARELEMIGGPEAGEHIRAIFAGFAQDASIGVYTIKPYKYRMEVVGEVMFRDKSGLVLSLNALQVTCGFALPWNGSGIQPKPSWPRKQTCVHMP